MTATGADGYQWRFEGVAIPEATNSSFTLTMVQPADAGSYTVVVSNAFGTATSPSAVLTVVAPLTVATFAGTQGAAGAVDETGLR